MIAHTIQLSVAPVFLLVAIGNLLNLLSTRLGRVVDRSRHLQDRHGQLDGDGRALSLAEMRLVDQRLVLISRAIRMLVLGGLAIGMTVAILFVEELLDKPLDRVAALFFLVAVALLMAGLWYFLLETQAAGAALRIPAEFWDERRDNVG